MLYKMKIHQIFGLLEVSQQYPAGLAMICVIGGPTVWQAFGSSLTVILLFFCHILFYSILSEIFCRNFHCCMLYDTGFHTDLALGRTQLWPCCSSLPPRYSTGTFPMEFGGWRDPAVVVITHIYTTLCVFLSSRISKRKGMLKQFKEY